MAWEDAPWRLTLSTLPPTCLESRSALTPNTPTLLPITTRSAASAVRRRAWTVWGSPGASPASPTAQRQRWSSRPRGRVRGEGGRHLASGQRSPDVLGEALSGEADGLCGLLRGDAVHHGVHLVAGVLRRKKSSSRMWRSRSLLFQARCGRVGSQTRQRPGRQRCVTPSFSSPTSPSGMSSQR